MLVGIQVCLSLILLLGAGLLVRTWRNLESVDLGFHHDGVLIADVDGTKAGYRGEALTRFYLDVQEQLERHTGVTSASFSWRTPLSGALGSVDIKLPDRVPQAGDIANPNFVSPRFMRTMQTAVHRGRDFQRADFIAATPAVVLVNEAFVRRYFADGSALGQRLSYGLPDAAEVVGVVADTIAGSIRQPPPPSLFIPYMPNRPVTFEVRASGPLSAISRDIERELRGRIPGARIEVRALSDQVQRTMVQERLLAILATAFGALALILAGIGLFGLLANGVAARTRVFGIRMALGAGPMALIRNAVGRAAVVVLSGAVSGIAIAVGVGHLIQSMLFGLDAADKPTVAAAFGVLLVVAVAATYIPARRAIGVNPATALREG